MNNLRRATMSLLSVSDSDETYSEPSVTMSLTEFANLFLTFAQESGFTGDSIDDLMNALATALNNKENT